MRVEDRTTTTTAPGSRCSSRRCHAESSRAAGAMLEAESVRDSSETRQGEGWAARTAWRPRPLESKV